MLTGGPSGSKISTSAAPRGVAIRKLGTAPYGALPQRHQVQQPPVRLVGSVVARVTVGLHPFPPGDQHRPPFPGCRAATDAVAVAHPQRPGQAGPPDVARPAERDGALGRLVRGRKERFRIDAAASPANAPCFIGAALLDRSKQPRVASCDSDLVRTRHPCPCHQPTSPVGPVKRVVLLRTVRTSTTPAKVCTARYEISTRGLIYLAIKLAVKNRPIHYGTHSEEGRFSNRRLHHLRPVVADVADRGADRTDLDGREFGRRHGRQMLVRVAAAGKPGHPPLR